MTRIDTATGPCFLPDDDTAAVDAAWDEVTARWPLPETSASRERWMTKHRPHLHAAADRHRNGCAERQLDLFDRGAA